MVKEQQKTSKVKAWISAMRLRTLPLSFSNVLLGTALAIFYIGTPIMPSVFHTKNWNIFALTLVTTLFLQILSNFANDYGDAKKGADNEGRIGPERAIQSGILSANEIKNGIIVTALLSLVSGSFLLLYSFDFELNWIFLLFFGLGLLAIAAAIKYTVGKKAYGYYGLGDLFVFIFFGLVGVIGSFYLQSHRLGWEIVPPAVTMGCWSIAVLNLNNMRDRLNDKAVGKMTLAVKLGFKKSKAYHYLLFTIAYACFPIPILIQSNFQPEILVAFFPTFLIHFMHIRKVIKIEDPKEFDPELKKVALSTFLFSITYFTLVTWIQFR